jgi:hypothetical protein
MPQKSAQKRPLNTYDFFWAPQCTTMALGWVPGVILGRALACPKKPAQKRPLNTCVFFGPPKFYTNGLVPAPRATPAPLPSQLVGGNPPQAPSPAGPLGLNSCNRLFRSRVWFYGGYISAPLIRGGPPWPVNYLRGELR